MEWSTRLLFFSSFLPLVEDDYAKGASVIDKIIMDLNCRLENFEQVILGFERVQNDMEAMSEVDKLDVNSVFNNSVAVNKNYN